MPDGKSARTLVKQAAARDAQAATDSLLNGLIAEGPAPARRGDSRVRRPKYKCAGCRDLGRLKIRGQIGSTEPCSMCDAAYVADPQHAESIIDSVIIRARPRR